MTTQDTPNEDDRKRNAAKPMKTTKKDKQRNEPRPDRYY
jgi:hypothetical protein